MKNIKQTLLWVLLIALLLGATYGAWKILEQNTLYSNNSDERRIRQERYVREPETIYTNFDKNLLRRIDFDALQKENVDATRWISIPGTAIDDAVVQERTLGVYQYLWSGLDGQHNGSGSYMVPATPIDPNTGEMAQDDHLMVLGHRMSSRKGEWKFSHLPTRWATEAGALNYPYVYIYYPDRVERYRVWTLATDVKGSTTSSESHNPEYMTPYTRDSDNYEAMLNYVASRGHYQVGRAPTRHDRTLMMSTCNTAHASGGRTHLTSVLDAEYFYETEELMEYE